MPQLASLVDGEPDLIANLANITAALRACLPVASWVGFYVRRGDELVLGPFQGKVACVRIAFGRGVCGTAAAERRTVIVADVEQFPGHIACDAGSRSEIVRADPARRSAWSRCSTSTATSSPRSMRPTPRGSRRSPSSLGTLAW